MVDFPKIEVEGDHHAAQLLRKGYHILVAEGTSILGKEIDHIEAKRSREKHAGLGREVGI